MKKDMRLSVKPLTTDLAEDYLDFFDNRAFADGNPNGPCYCTVATQEEEEAQQMVREFEEYGCQPTVRRYAAQMLKEGRIHGYLAYDGDVSIGWINAGDMDLYKDKGFDHPRAREISCGKTISIVCLEIMTDYWRQGVATALVRRVVEDARNNGYDAVEAYPAIVNELGPYDMFGPMGLWEKTGFEEVERVDKGYIIMRNKL